MPWRPSILHAQQHTISGVVSSPKLAAKALRLSNLELVDFATQRAHFPHAAPKLAQVLEGELERRSTLSLQQASTLLFSAVQLKLRETTKLLCLSHRALEAKAAMPAVQLLKAHARCEPVEGTEVRSRLLLDLAQLSIRGRALPGRLVEEVLLALDTLPLPTELQEAALHQLSRGAPRFAALAQLWRAAGVGLRGRLRDEVFARTALSLRLQLFWWRHGVRKSWHKLPARTIRDCLATSVDDFNRSLWDVGLVQELQRHIDEELAEALQADELIRFLQLVDHLALLRAVRPPMWRSFMFALLRSRDRWPQDVQTLPLMMGLLRRTPFQGLVPSELLSHAVAHAGPTISRADCLELASMLSSWERLLSPAAFRQALLQHQQLLRERLNDQPFQEPPAVLLAALAKGSRTSKQRPAWWRKEVLRPWGAQLRRLCFALRGGGRLARWRYAQELQSFQVADLGLSWQEPVLRAIGVGISPLDFARSAARVVLRQRRRTDASSPMAMRALGLLQWNLEGDEGRKLIFTAARNMKAEIDADKLLSVDLGTVESRASSSGPYRRHGDVERVALLEIMRRHRGALKRVVGTVDLFVDRAICLSCLGVLAQFCAKVPGVKVRVASFGPSSFSRQPTLARTVGGLLRDDAMDTSLAAQVERIRLQAVNDHLFPGRGDAAHRSE